MMQILKNHKWAIFLALLASVIIVYPQIYLRYDLSDVYQGVEIIGASEDEMAWLSRVREAYDGHSSISNAYFKEGKDDPYLVQPLGSKMVALSTSSFLVLANALFSRPALFEILKGQSPSLSYINYTRPVNPLMTSF